MARVPVYDNFQVTPGIRTGQAATSLTTDQASVAGRQSQQIGNGLTNAGGALGEIVQAEQDRANKVRVNDAYNQAIMKAQDLRKQYGEIKGGDVMGVGEDKRPLADHYYDELNKQLGEIHNGLNNTAVRDQFSVLADDLTTRFRGDALAYEAEQSAVYEKQVLDTTVITSFDVISEDPFKPGVVDINVSRARDALYAKFDAQGLDAAGIEEQTKAVLGKGHTNVIDTLLESSNTAGAKTYFDAHRTDFNGADEAAMEAKLGKAGVASKALETVDALLASKPLSGRQIKRSTLDAELRKMVGDDPVLLKAARDELNYQIGQYEDQAQDAYVKNFDNVLGMIITGTPPTELYQNPAWLSLDSKDSYNLYEMMKGLDDTERQKDWAVATSDLLYTTEGRNRLVNMTEEELTREINNVGPDNLNALRRARQTYIDTPAKLSEASISSNRFDVIADQMGFEPFKKKPTAEEKAELAELRYNLTTILDEVQRSKGRKLTGPEQDAIIRQELANKVLLKTKAWWGGGEGKPREETRLLLEPSDVQKIIVPAADSTAIAISLQRQFELTGDPSFDPKNSANIRRVYLKKQGLADGTE